jgi:hypothetical protein
MKVRGLIIDLISESMFNFTPVMNRADFKM